MLGVLNYLTLIMLVAFLSIYIGKLVIMRSRDKIKANVLTKGKKDKVIKRAEISVKVTTFIWGLLWLILPLGEIIYHKNFDYFGFSYLVRIAGVFIIPIGLLFFTLSVVSMKSSWRVGIDKSTKTTLVTEGIYEISRNPAFVGFDLMFIGLFIAYPNLLILLVVASCMVSIHLLIKQEELHLTASFGKEYIEYKQNTPRYLLF